VVDLEASAAIADELENLQRLRPQVLVDNTMLVLRSQDARAPGVQSKPVWHLQKWLIKDVPASNRDRQREIAARLGGTGT
jgi:hypothetical protein